MKILQLKLVSALSLLFMVTASYGQWNISGNNSSTGNLTLGGTIQVSGNQIRFSEARGFDYEPTEDAVFYNGLTNGRVVKLGDLNGNGWFQGKLAIGTNSSSSTAKLFINNPDNGVMSALLSTTDADISFGGHALNLQSKSTFNQVPYIGWTNKNAVRMGYMGWRTDVLNLQLENGFNFAINGGNVGIGLFNPLFKLHIWDGGSSVYTGLGFVPGSGPSEDAILRIMKDSNKGMLFKAMNQDNGKGQSVLYLMSGNYTSSKATLMARTIELRSGTDYNDNINSSGFGISAVFIGPDQKVGIGTVNPTERLSVNGKIVAEEVQVIVDVLPDYVFEPDYNLMSLEEVEKYIEIHKHLPEVPSAKYVKENGMNVGEMETILLKKVEELTLYNIAQQKKIKLLEENARSVQSLGDKVDALLEHISKQENEIQELRSKVNELE